MMVLLDTNDAQWQMAPAELGSGMEIGQLVTPAPGYSYRGGMWAGDCSGYGGVNVPRWRAIVKRQLPFIDKCIFQVVPDAAMSARRTRELFDYFRPELQGWPRAYVTQNGQENIEIPWNEIEALFIGGDDTHKDGPEGYSCAKAAIAREKHLHFGRVNGQVRVAKIVEAFGWYPRFSIDGSGISQYSHMRLKLGKAIRNEGEDPALFPHQVDPASEKAA